MDLYTTPRNGQIEANFLPAGSEFKAEESNLPQRLLFAAVWVIAIVLILGFLKIRVRI